MTATNAFFATSPLAKSRQRVHPLGMSDAAVAPGSNMRWLTARVPRVFAHRRKRSAFPARRVCLNVSVSIDGSRLQSAVLPLSSQLPLREQAQLSEPLPDPRVESLAVPSMDSAQKLSPQSSRSINLTATREDYQTDGFPGNRITSARYSIATFLPKQLFIQFSKLANVYFLFIACIQLVPDWSPTGRYTTLLPLLLFVALAMAREAYDDRLRHKHDGLENNDCTEVISYNKQGGMYTDVCWEVRPWQNIHVGDIVRVKKDKSVPCDLVILKTPLEQGICYIQTSQLDGESNLKQRQAIAEINETTPTLDSLISMQAVFEAESPNDDLYNFDGRVTLTSDVHIPLTLNQLLLRGTTLRNTPEVVGLAIFTGEETKIRMNANKNKRNKASNLQKQTNKVIIVIFGCVIVLAMVSTLINYSWINNSESYIRILGLERLETTNYAAAFFTFVILYNTMIPISLYVTLEVVKIAQAKFINLDVGMYHAATDCPAEARTSTLNEELGQVSYLFSDKTGTLTENNMVFKNMSIGGIEFRHLNDLETGPVEILSSNCDLFESQVVTQVLTSDFSSIIEQNNGSNHVGGIESSLIGSSNSTENLSRSGNAIALNSPSIILQRSTRNIGHQLSTYQEHPLSKRITFFLRSIALCHQAIPDLEPVPMPTRDTLRRKPLSSVTSISKMSMDLLLIVYQAASPDEIALVNAAREMGFTLTGRTAKTITLNQLGQQVEFSILNVIEFSSSRKRMSIILRFPEDNRIVMLTKGADSLMLERAQSTDQLSLEDQNIHNQTLQHIEKFALSGLRTLVYGYRELTEVEYQEWSKIFLQASTSVTDRVQKLENAADLIERKWTIIGATGIEDRLQRGVPETIKNLERAGIKVWVLTGDKKETAVSVAQACGLARAHHRVFIIDSTDSDGKCISKEALSEQFRNYANEIMEFSRSSLQETQSSPPLVNTIGLPTVNRTESTIAPIKDDRWKSRLQKRPKSPTSLSIANLGKPFVIVIDGLTLGQLFELGDETLEKLMHVCSNAFSVLCCRVSPLQKSLVVKCGIGIAGREGMQAACSSDYSIAQFYFLQRLLFVHGHWSYLRVSRFTLGTFYKCILFYCTQAFFQMYTGFSGTSLYEQVTLIMYNILFSSLPVIILGIFDRDLSDELLCEYPEIYRSGQRNAEFSVRIFLIWMLKGIMQAILTVFGTFLLHAGFYTSINQDTNLNIQPKDSSSSLYMLGTISYTIVVLTATIQICYITPSTLTLPLHGCAAFTIGIWFLWLIVYTRIWPAVGISVGHESYGIWKEMVTSSYPTTSKSSDIETCLWWAAIIIIVSLSVAPEWIFHKIKQSEQPHDVDRLREMKQTQELTESKRAIQRERMEKSEISSSLTAAVSLQPNPHLRPQKILNTLIKDSSETVRPLPLPTVLVQDSLGFKR